MKDCHSLTSELISAGKFSISRRNFVKFATLGAGASLFMAAAPARASGGTDALLLSCMDYRLIDDLAKFMDSKGLTNKYDHVVLAGASAGAHHEKFSAWHDTFWSHLQVAIDLHKIKEVKIVDHRDCGAYKIAIGKDHTKTSQDELDDHTQILLPLAQKIKEKYPHLAVETYLMDLKGGVEQINA